MEDLENSDEDNIANEIISSLMRQDPEDSNSDHLTNRVDKTKNDSSVNLQSLLAGTDKLGYEPPDRSQNNRMMSAILDGIIPEDTVDPSENFVENVNVSSFIRIVYCMEIILL